MPILPFQPDVLRHVVKRVTVGHRYQLDNTPSIILSARLAGVDGTVVATVYTDEEPNYVSDNPETAESETDLIALAVKEGTSDSQNPMAPPTHADYGVYVKAEGTTDKVALLELTYVHRVDYERSFEPIKIETVEGQFPALDVFRTLPDVPTWEEGTDSGGGDSGSNTVNNFQDASSLMVPIGESPEGDPYDPYPKQGPVGGGYVYTYPPELWIIEGQADGFKVKLGPDNTPPKNDIIISVTSSSTADLTVSPSTLTFTSANFKTAQTVTATAVDDASTESTENVAIDFAVTQGDNVNYTTDSNTTVVAHVLDTDSNTAGINVSRKEAHLVEGDDAITLKVSLTRQPSANVTVVVGDDTEDSRWETGVSSSYASTKTLTFTNANWLTAQDVTLRATANTTVEDINPHRGTFTYQVTASSDSNYSSLIGNVYSLPVLVYDNDASNFAVGTFIIETENRTDAGDSQIITTESGNALIRNE